MSEIINSTENENWLLNLIDSQQYQIEKLKQKHVDDMSYCIQQINLLKTENESLKAEIEYFNITFSCYVDAINELKARIEILEQNL